MKIPGSTFIVTGGASGLGAATVRALIDRGGSVAVGDLAEPEAGQSERSLFIRTDVCSEADVSALIEACRDRLGPIAGLVNCAGIAVSERVLGRERVHPLELFDRCIQTNLVGTFNTCRLVAAAMADSPESDDDERGVVVNTASVAAYDGQIGQVAYAASKGGVVSMTLPLAREFARVGIRVVAIAPGVFATPMMAELPEKAQEALAQSIPFPSRLGKPEEYASLVCHVIENVMLNGETIRLDGALRLPPR